MDNPFYSLFPDDPEPPKYCDRSQKSQYCYKPWEGPIERFTLNGLARLLQDHLGGPKEGIVIIEDIGKEAISVLKEEIPGLDLHFLYEHVLRLEIPQPSCISHPEQYHVEQVPPYARPSGSPYGLHFDGDYTLGSNPSVLQDGFDLAMSFSNVHHFGSKEYRYETFARLQGTWYRASTRISCCVLEPDLCG